jgi:hypothetical protein
MSHVLNQTWKSSLVAGVVGGVLLGSFMVWAAWEHNPQQAFHGSDGVSWASLLNLGLVWLSVGGALTGAMSCVMRWRPAAAVPSAT